MEQEKILEVRNLWKNFGEKQVLRGVDLNITAGQIMGFVGENGAGKTTTMRIILGLERAAKGEVQIMGEQVIYGSSRTNRYVGFLPDVPEFYPYMTAAEYLFLCGKIAGMDKRQIKERTEELLSLVGLAQERGRIGRFSRGMKQRLGIAQALLGKPRLLICDEPTSALSPKKRLEMLDLLVEVAKDSAVLFSTHILSDVERICTDAALLRDGRVTEFDRSHIGELARIFEESIDEESDREDF